MLLSAMAERGRQLRLARDALDRVIHTHLLGEARRPGGAPLREVAGVDADLRGLTELAYLRPLDKLFRVHLSPYARHLIVLV